MQMVVSGLILGCVYGLLAFGMILIFKTTDVVNFAQGEMAMFVTFISFVLLSSFNTPYFISLLVTLLIALFLGMLIYQLVMKRVQTAHSLNQTVVTLGLFLVINGIAGMIWGYNPYSYPQALEGNPYSIGNVFITPNEIFMFVSTTVLVLLFFLLFRYSKIGLAMRATSQDMLASELMGIKVSRVFISIWGVAAMLGAFAGMMTAPITFLSPNMMTNTLIMAFAAAVLGGFMSLPGALIGGMIIGVFENLVNYYIAPELKVVYTFILIVAILYIRPQGIFGGRKSVKKV